MTVEPFLVFSCREHLASLVSRYNIHGKKLLETNDKVYFGDVGDDIEKKWKISFTNRWCVWIMT